MKARVSQFRALVVIGIITGASPSAYATAIFASSAEVEYTFTNIVNTDATRLFDLSGLSVSVSFDEDLVRESATGVATATADGSADTIGSSSTVRQGDTITVQASASGGVTDDGRARARFNSEARVRVRNTSATDSFLILSTIEESLAVAIDINDIFGDESAEANAEIFYDWLGSDVDREVSIDVDRNREGKESDNHTDSKLGSIGVAPGDSFSYFIRAEAWGEARAEPPDPGPDPDPDPGPDPDPDPAPDPDPGASPVHHKFFLQFDEAVAGAVFDVPDEILGNDASGLPMQDAFVVPDWFDRNPGESQDAATERFKAEFLTLLEADFSEYAPAISFTLSDPSMSSDPGDFSTIFMVTGDEATAVLTASNPDRLGRAAKVDVLLEFSNDSAFILIDQFGKETRRQDIGAIAATTAHEIGHLLGLQHVVDPRNEELMEQRLKGEDDTFTDRDLSLKIHDSYDPILWEGLEQNSDCALREISQLTVPDNCPNRFIPNYMYQYEYFTDDQIFNAGIGFVFEGDDVSSVFIDIGDIVGSTAGVIEIPLGAQQFYFAGSSQPGGPYDIFSSQFAVDIVGDLTRQSLFYDLTTSPSEVNLFQAFDDQIMPFGNLMASVMVVPTAAVAPTVLTLVILPIVFLARRRRTKLLKYV